MYLVKCLKPAAAALNYRAVVARIADHNEASLAVHEKLGFTLVGMMQAVGWKFGRWISMWILWNWCCRSLSIRVKILYQVACKGLLNSTPESPSLLAEERGKLNKEGAIFSNVC